MTETNAKPELIAATTDETAAAITLIETIIEFVRRAQMKNSAGVLLYKSETAAALVITCEVIDPIERRDPHAN